MWNKLQEKCWRKKVTLPANLTLATAKALGAAIGTELMDKLKPVDDDLANVNRLIIDVEGRIPYLDRADTQRQQYLENQRLQELKQKRTQLQQTLERLKKNVEDLEGQQVSAAAQHRVYAHLGDALLKFKPVDPLPDWQGGERLRPLEEIRADIETLAQELRAVERADRAAEDMRPAIISWVNNAIRLSFADTTMRRFLSSKAPHVPLPSDGQGFGYYAWFVGPEKFADQAIANLTADGHALGLPAELRAAKLKELRDQMLLLECEEEDCILDLERQGKTPLRRAEASPAALFAVWATYDPDRVAA